MPGSRISPTKLIGTHEETILDVSPRRGPGSDGATQRRPEARLESGGPAGMLTSWLTLAALVAASGSLFFPALLTGAAVTDGNLRGTAFVVVVLAVPTLWVGKRWAAAGSARGLAVWLGATAYLTYQGVMFCFATPMNSLFLPYVAFLGLGLWTLVSLLVHIDLTTLNRQVTRRTPYRSSAALLAALAALNGLAWLVRVLPATFTDDPQSALEGSGLLTSPVYVQDLAIWIPAALVAAHLTWARKPDGLLLTASMLAFYVLECLSVASDQWWGVRADDSVPALASMSAVPGALAAALVSGLAFLWCLRGVIPEPVSVQPERALDP